MTDADGQEMTELPSFDEMTPDERAEILRASMPPDLRDKMDELVAEALRIVASREPEPEPQSRVCSVCGTLEEDTAWGSLIDISVITADGEEGEAYVTQLLCDKQNCFYRIQQALMDLGFVDHHHGGIDFLEDLMCCNGVSAYENCPTPTHGRIIVTPNGPQQVEP